jgi:hypothetical protein
METPRYDEIEGLSQVVARNIRDVLRDEKEGEIL